MNEIEKCIYCEEEKLLEKREFFDEEDNQDKILVYCLNCQGSWIEKTESE